VTTVVVSPLIALMKDQCDKLRELGVAAVQLNSAVGADEIDAAEKAPRRWRGEDRLHDARAARRRRVPRSGRAAIRRASSSSTSALHLAVGHDFRPAFLEIGTRLPQLGKPTVLGPDGDRDRGGDRRQSRASSASASFADRPAPALPRRTCTTACSRSPTRTRSCSAR
jgi:hypothetical protein